MEDIERLKKMHSVLLFVEPFLQSHPEAELFLVGGAVRDLLLKRRLTGVDFDFVIRNVKKEQLEAWFSARGTIDLVGRTFGVYKFLESHSPLSGESRHLVASDFIDIALPRTEQSSQKSLGGYKDFDVQSDETLPIETDLARRDFTINAMAINMRSGEMIDPFHGQHDLDKKLIRAVGDPNERFAEDLTRMLRAVRFASQLHFTIEEQTLKAICDQAGRLNDTREEADKTNYVVSRETIGSELAKAFSSDPKKTLETLRQTSLFEILFQAVALLCTKDHTYLTPFETLPENNLALTISLLLRGLQPAEIHPQLTLCGLDSLPRTSPRRIDPSEIFFLVQRLQETASEEEIKKMRASTFEKYFMGSHSNLLIKALGVLRRFTCVEAVKNRIQKISTTWSVDRDEPIYPLLSGNDILAAGIPAGPKVRELLELLRDEQLDGRILTREAALTWLKKQIKKT